MHLVTEQSFNEQVLEGKGFVLCDFQTEWCGPCKQQLQTLQELVLEIDVPVFTMNIDKQLDICIKYNIQSVPTIILFQDGKVIAVKRGYQNKTQILELLTDRGAI